MCKNSHSERPPGKNIAITVVSEVTAVFKTVLKTFHVVLECPNGFNSSFFVFALVKGREKHYTSAKVRDSAPYILSSCIRL